MPEGHIPEPTNGVQPTPAKASGSETRQRNASASVRLTAPEKDILTQAADQRRISLGSFMRDAAMLTAATQGLVDMREAEDMALVPKRRRVSRTEGRQIALVLACMARLSDTLQAFEAASTASHQASSEEVILMIAAMRREIMDVRDACFTALGRTP
ncbi:MAG: hypothetical protein CME88_09895 [Hirschia sp.]|nr:hypothetical protein [Hirschia sp.]MBF18679.1 hypothetical protein [Hirschia sp.]|tara:strand:- start:45 stop:515 length:471 start_codon:yes stop_codon:yes gene_type:complete